MFIAHFLATTIVLKAFAVSDVKVILVSYFFGVLIDLDHIYTLLKISRSKSVSPWEFIRDNLIFNKEHYEFRTFFQESGGLVLSLVASLLVKSPAPFLSMLAHCIMDWSSNFDSRPLSPFYRKFITRGFIKEFKTQEFAVIVALSLILLLLFLV